MKKMTNMSTKNPIEHWMDSALALAAETVAPPSQPVVNYLQEADGVAHFLEKHWRPEKDRPGLCSVAAVAPLALAGEIRELVQAGRAMQTQVLYPDDPQPKAWRTALDEGRLVSAELRAALEFVLADGLGDVSDAALEAASRREDGSPAALAQALSDYAGIAEKTLDKLCAIEGFDPQTVTRARELAAEITAEGPPVLRRTASTAVDLRNRLLTLLEARVATVRRAARYVFRSQPELVRQVTSEYSRKQRASHRRRRAETQPATEPSPEVDLSRE